MARMADLVPEVQTHRRPTEPAMEGPAYTCGHTLLPIRTISVIERVGYPLGVGPPRGTQRLPGPALHLCGCSRDHAERVGAHAAADAAALVGRSSRAAGVGRGIRDAALPAGGDWGSRGTAHRGLRGHLG